METTSLEVCSKKFDGKEWYYITATRKVFKEKQWNYLVKKHIEENNMQRQFKVKTEEAKRLKWYRYDTVENFALQLYAKVYCKNVVVKEKKNFKIKIDDMGAQQFSFF